MRRKRLKNNPLTSGVILKQILRALDSLPLWAQLNITTRCNLNCGYCVEHDETKEHVPFDILIKRINHCKELGCVHTDLIGGEPLLHPDIIKLLHHVTSLGMTTGMTTNGFLLTEEKLDQLIDAGVGRLQISIDSMEPNKTTRKSIKLLRKNLEMASRKNIWVLVRTVICKETANEAKRVAEACFEMGIPIGFAIEHHKGEINYKNAGVYLKHIEWLRQKKLEGYPVDAPFFLMEFRKKMLNEPFDWKCMAGVKSFYVTYDGKFQFCHHNPSAVDFLSLKKGDLKQFNTKKGCEESCGLDCVAHTSLPYSNSMFCLKETIKGRFNSLLINKGLHIDKQGKKDEVQPAFDRSIEIKQKHHGKIMALTDSGSFAVEKLK